MISLEEIVVVLAQDNVRGRIDEFLYVGNLYGDREMWREEGGEDGEESGWNTDIDGARGGTDVDGASPEVEVKFLLRERNN